MTLLSGLGQAGAFTEEALQQKMAELASIRSEIASVEAEIQRVRTGGSVPQVAPGPGRIQAQEQQFAPPPPPQEGMVDLPIVGRVSLKTLAIGAAAAALLWRRK